MRYYFVCSPDSGFDAKTLEMNPSVHVHVYIQMAISQNFLLSFMLYLFVVYAEKLHMPGDHVFLVYSVEVSDVIQQGKVQSGIKLTTGTVSSVTWSCCHVYISRVVWCLVVWFLISILTFVSIQGSCSCNPKHDLWRKRNCWNMCLKLIKLNVSLLTKKGNGKNTLVNLIFFI